MVTRGHRRGGELEPNDGACIQVIVPGAFAQRVHLDVAFGVAWKGQCTALLEQRLKPDFISGLRGI
jgi:hypothetical protein